MKGCFFLLFYFSVLHLQSSESTVMQHSLPNGKLKTYILDYKYSNASDYYIYFPVLSLYLLQFFFKMAKVNVQNKSHVAEQCDLGCFFTCHP